VESEPGRGSTFRFTLSSDYERNGDSNPATAPATVTSTTSTTAAPFGRPLTA
jgi:hypothetical protein